MADLESLNSFFCDRLMAVAAEIFQVVRETVCQYQEETERTKQENVYLRKLLAEVSSSSSNVADTESSQLEVFPPQPVHEMLDSDSSLIQVKLELSAMQQDLVSQPPLAESPACEPPAIAANPQCIPAHEDEEVAVKLECSDLQEEALNSADRVDGFEVNAQSSSSSQCDITHLPFHLQSPVAQRLFRSKMCPKPGKKGGQKSGHMKARKVTSKAGTRLRCDLCGKWYSTTHSLKLHLRTHTGERPFPCKFCVKTFHQKVHLKEHERTHTGEKPFSCSACGKLFSRSHQVKLHIQNHHHDEVATIIKNQQYS